MAKETKLNESADIYQPRVKQTEKQKLSEMNFKEKLGYFNQYYKYKLLVTIATLAFIIYLMYTIFSPKIETVFYAAIINNYMDTATSDELIAGFSEHLELDNEKSDINIDSTYFIDHEGSGSSSMQAEQKLGVLVAAQEIDVIIAPAKDFKNMAYYAYFDDLSDQLPTDLYTRLTDKLYFSNTEDDKEEEKSFGIYLDGAKVFDKNGTLMESPVMGIITNSKYKSNTIEFIKYLFNLN